MERAATPLHWAAVAKELEKVIPFLDATAREELVTSIVRQWVTCEGHAGVFTEFVNYWFHFAEIGGEIHAQDARRMTSIADGVPAALPEAVGSFRNGDLREVVQHE